MNTEIQSLIVLILGIDAIIALLGIFFLLAFTPYDANIILTLVAVATAPVNILGGFVAGKTLTEKQEETFLENVETESCEDDVA